MRSGTLAGALGASGWRYFCTALLGLYAIMICSISAHSAPIISSNSFGGPKNTAVTGTLTATGSGGVLTFSLVTAPVHGTVVLNADGSFTYRPNAEYTGGDSFKYLVEETGGTTGGSSQGTAYFTISDVSPQVTAVSVPASGYYGERSTLIFSVAFDQNVYVTGRPSLSLTIGSTSRSAEYASGSGTRVLSFTYSVQSGDMDMDGITLGSSIAMNGGTILSNTSLSAMPSLNAVGSTVGVLVNTSSPTAVITTSSLPSDAVQHFVVTFSETVWGLAATDFAFTTTGNVGVTPSEVQTSSNLVYTFDVSVTGNGSLGVQLPSGAVESKYGNPNTPSNTMTVPILQSSDANLTSLVSRAGTLTPAFSPGTTSYTLNVANDVETIAFTPTLSDTRGAIVINGATIPNGTATPPINLAVGSNTVTTTITALDGITKKTYTVNVIRAQSGNAGLVGLAPSVGTLEPAFSPSTAMYSLTVPTNTSSLQLAPTSADAAATITVNGATVSSGSSSNALQLGAGTTTLTVVVTAPNGTTRSYTINVTKAASADATLASLVPSVGSLDPAFDKETLSYSLNVENTVESISFAPTVSEPLARVSVAGNGVASGSSSAPVGLAVGSNTISIVVTAPSGANRSYTVVVSRAAMVFPDPSLDPEVIGLLNAQTSAARRFAQVQTRNFQNRLEQLHDEGDRRRSSLGVRLGGSSSTQQPEDPANPSSSASSGGISPLGYASEKRDAFPGKAIGLKEPEQPQQSFEPDLGPVALWSSGFVNFGQRDSGKLDLDYMLVGVSGGIDYRFSERFVAGFGVGYGRDRTDIGDNGTESRANAYSAAVFGSFKPIDNFFIDALVGGSILDFDSTRFITADGSLTDGKRDGHQLFGSVTAAYEFRQEAWLVSPYGRMEMSRSWLDGYSEGGDSIYRLTYSDQTVDTVTGVVGLRANYSIDYTWGRLTPGVRAEYAHDFQGSSRAAMGYSALGGLPYALDVEGESTDSGNVGLSLDFSFDNACVTGIEYRTGFGGSGARDHAIALRVGAKF